MHEDQNYLLANEHTAELSQPATHSTGATAHVPFSRALALADGTQIEIRPLTPEDRGGIAALFSRLSSESRYRRFLGPKHELTDRELVFFTDVDHVTHEALASVDQRDGSVVGVARYVQYSDRPRVAAVAFEVADERQRLGIGTALAERLLDRARINGLDGLSATTRWENLPARALLRRLGFRARASRGGEIELDLTLPAVASARPIGSVGRSA